MTEEQAKDYLTKEYICCCPCGTSPTKCNDEKCEFGQAIRALLKAVNGMGKLKEFENHIFCCECGLVLDKKLLPMANSENCPPTYMVNYCMRCGCEFTEIEQN